MSVSKIIRIMNRKKNILGILLCWCCFVSGYGQSQYGTFYVKFAGDSKSYSALRDTKDNNINPRIIESQRLFQNLTQKQIKGTRLNRKALSLHVGGALQSCYQVNFDGIDNEQENDSIFAMLSSMPGVERVEKATTMEIMSMDGNIPNDPLLHLNQITGGWHLNQIGFDKIYGKYHGSPDVRVAIIDNAVWGDHPDLQIKPENQYFAYIEETGNSAPPSNIPQDYECGTMDGCESSEWSHGTHCAGLVGAITDNNEGIASFASGVTLLSARASDVQPRTMNRQMECLLWAVDNGADILSLSWGSSGMSDTEVEIIENILKQGVIVIAAAGNNGNNVKMYPAAIDGVISVASVDSDNKISPFSTYGNWVDIAAPGGYLKDEEGNITPTSDLILSTTYSVSQQYRLDGLNEIDGMFYDGKVGTSMATPLVSSVVALMLSVNPDLTSEDVINILTSTATKVDGLPISPDGGVINAAAAVEKAAETSGIEANIMNAKADIYPEINGGLLTVHGAEEALRVNIVNASGSIIYNNKYTEHIDISALSKGVYLLNAIFAEHTATAKFVKR